MATFIFVIFGGCKRKAKIPDSIQEDAQEPVSTMKEQAIIITHLYPSIQLFIILYLYNNTLTLYHVGLHEYIHE